MLNRLKFNNLVISNKKGLQDSRIQTINKLVHKIRRLKSLLQKHPDDSKCKERIRKSTEAMEVLKQLKRVDVIKKVLLMDRHASAVITDGAATPEEVAVALLSMNKIMLGLAKKFKAELHLNATEIEWKQSLMESSKRRQKIERTEEKRGKRLELKQQKVMGRKRQEWLEENQNMSENKSIDVDSSVSTTTGWHIEELSNNTNNKEVIERIENMSNDEIEEHIKGKAYSKKNSASNKEQKNENSKVECGKFKKERKANNEVNKTKEKFNTFEPPQNESYNDAADDTSGCLVIDPFFITDTGENYMSISKSQRENSVETPSDSKHPRIQYRDKNKKYLMQKNKLMDEEGLRSTWQNKQKTETEKFSRYKWSDKKNETKLQGSRRTQFRNNSDEKTLHPSWAAKQNLKPNITRFQGKKIRFNDDDFSEPKNHEEKEAKTIKSTSLNPTKPEKDSLHPSWAAKQKLKPSIKAFEGKKITFDYDE